MGNSHTVVMYGRLACHLCDEARAVILRERARGSEFDFAEKTIDGDDALEREFGLRVPVVVVDGREEFEIAVEPGRLHRLVGPRPGGL